MFYVLFFFSKAENNRLTKKPVSQNFVILFFCFYLKQGRSGPQTNKLTWSRLVLCACNMYLFIFFSLSVLLKLLKYVKLIVFKNYNKCKTKHLLLIKKVVTRFDKKTATLRKESIVEEMNLLLRTLKKKTLSLRTQRRPCH